MYKKFSTRSLVKEVNRICDGEGRRFMPTTTRHSAKLKELSTSPECVRPTKRELKLGALKVRLAKNKLPLAFFKLFNQHKVHHQAGRESCYGFARCNVFETITGYPGAARLAELTDIPYVRNPVTF